MKCQRSPVGYFGDCSSDDAVEGGFFAVCCNSAYFVIKVMENFLVLCRF